MIVVHRLLNQFCSVGYIQRRPNWQCKSYNSLLTDFWLRIRNMRAWKKNISRLGWIVNGDDDDNDDDSCSWHTLNRLRFIYLCTWIHIKCILECQRSSSSGSGGGGLFFYLNARACPLIRRCTDRWTVECKSFAVSVCMWWPCQRRTYSSNTANSTAHALFQAKHRRASTPTIRSLVRRRWQQRQDSSYPCTYPCSIHHTSYRRNIIKYNTHKLMV